MIILLVVVIVGMITTYCIIGEKEEFDERERKKTLQDKKAR